MSLSANILGLVLFYAQEPSILMNIKKTKRLISFANEAEYHDMDLSV